MTPGKRRQLEHAHVKTIDAGRDVRLLIEKAAVRTSTDATLVLPHDRAVEPGARPKRQC